MEKIKKILGMTLIVAVLLSGVQFAAQPSASASEPLSDSNEVPAVTADEPTSAVLEAPLEGKSVKLEGIEEPRGAWFGVTEDFEDPSWPGLNWNVFDNDGMTNGEYYWNATTCHDFGSGDSDAVPHAAGADGTMYYTCWTPYPANLNSWMVWGPFDLTGFTTAEVSFDLDLHSESGADYFKWMASINGTNFYGYQTSGDTGGWVTKSLDLTNVPTLGNVCGQSQVWIAFLFQSDGISDSYAGPWVDDISLEASSEPLLNYITTADNENNYHTGTADGDMYPGNTDCIYNNNYKPNCPGLQNPLAPIEFNIVVPTLPSFTTAELSLYAWDVDEQGDPGNPTRPKERDEVYLNGHFLGTLTGADQVWSTSHFNIPNPSWVQQGDNLVEVSIDDYDGCWCVMIDWGQLVLGGGGGQAFIRSWGPLMDCWPPGTQQHVMVEVDTSLSSQDVLVEVKVVDSQNVTLIQNSDTKTINGSQDDDFLFLLDVPTTAATGYYTLEVIVYDAYTYVQQDYDYQTVEINPACGPPSPCTVHLESSQDNYATSNKGTITFHSISYSLPDDASVGQGSYYATYYPDSGYEFVEWDWSGNISVSNSNSQTTEVEVSCGGTLTAIYELYQKPDPCTVEGDKTAQPDTVDAGDKVWVTITLHGLDDCPVTAEHADVMLVVDRSGSMSGTPLQDAKNAAKAFVDRLDLSSGGDQVGLVSYSDSATLNHQLSTSASSVKAAIDGLVSGGYTNITDGINKAQAELETSRHDPANQPVIILMTDGVHNVGAVPGPAADAAKAKGTRIFTIGLGSVDEAQLQSLASSPSDYYYAPTSSDLEAIYQQIAGALMTGVPARDLTLVDVLSDDVTYVPGSASPVPDSISPDNKTLTWEIATLGRDEWKTFTYQVTISQTAEGLVCINDSTTATYTDSNGDPATLPIDPACVTVESEEGPPCTVEGDKTAHPDQVEPGGETTVVITLDGWGDCLSVAKNADVMLVIDRSGSMSGTPLQDAKNAAKAFVDRLDLSSGGDQAGLVSYSDSATLDHQLSRSRGSVRTAIDALASGGSTNITDGINKAQAELESSRHDPANGPVMILMTDGVHNVGPVPGPAAAAAKASGTRIFTIGLGSVDETELQSLASSPSDYYYAATSDELDYIYQQIAGSLMGLPATNITLVDTLSDDVTYIAGSAWPVPYSISPDNKVLTWKIPTLGRNQTRTFAYRVKVSETAQGVVCINDSTTATYTDSNGHTATLDIPPACVTVKLQSHDCYCKDHDGDDGSVPSNPNGEAWWESPDIWVRHQQDGIEQHQNPEGCQINYVYAKVRNRGNTTMTDIEVDLYWSDGAVAIVWPGGWTYIGTATISSLAPGQVRVVNVPWHPLVSGHYCFLERIHSAQDPVRHEGLVPFDNNLCQKNVQVIETTEQGWSDNDVTVRNPQDNTVQTDVTIDSSNYPPDGTVTVDVDPDVFDRWQDNGGDLQGGQVIPGTTSMQLDVSPTGEVAATIGRIPLDASEETTMELTLQVGSQTSLKAGEQAGIQPKLDTAGSKAKVGVRQIIEGQDVGGSVYGPPTEIAAAAEGLDTIMDNLVMAYGYKAGEGVGGWTVYNPAWAAAHPEWNTLTTLYVSRGYWLELSQACDLTYEANTYELDEGWNLIGWCGATAVSPPAPEDNPDAATGLDFIEEQLAMAYGYKAGEGVGGWTVYNPQWAAAHPEWNSLTTLYLQRGYWIDVEQACGLEYGSQLYGLDEGWNLIGWLGG